MYSRFGTDRWIDRPANVLAGFDRRLEPIEGSREDEAQGLSFAHRCDRPVEVVEGSGAVAHAR